MRITHTMNATHAMLLALLLAVLWLCKGQKDKFEGVSTTYGFPNTNNLIRVAATHARA